MLNIIAIIRVGWEWGTLSISLIKVSCLFTSPLGKHHPYCPVYSMITCRFLTPFLFTHCLSCYSYILVCGFLSMRNILSYSLHSYYICLFRTKYIATHHILCSNAISNFVSMVNFLVQFVALDLILINICTTLMFSLVNYYWSLLYGYFPYVIPAILHYIIFLSWVILPVSLTNSKVNLLWFHYLCFLSIN